MIRFCGSLIVALLIVAGAATAQERPGDLDLSAPGWHGAAIAYSGYRTGQHPDRHLFPAPDQVRQDLLIIAKNWRIIRLYGAGPHAEDVLKTIRSDRIALKVMLGVWLSGDPAKLNANSLEISRAIRLANEYPDIVAAVSVGNEILVSWSDHRMTEDQALRYVAEAKEHLRCPVTIADDSLYWRSGPAKVAATLDFITMHTYPMWGGEDIDTALASTIRTYEAVRAANPGKTVVIGEAGWASVADNPKNASGAGSEDKQKQYYDELMAWARGAGVTVFVFEAFDEPWKGNGTEGHWGLFREDRTAKKAMRERYSEPGVPAP